MTQEERARPDGVDPSIQQKGVRGSCEEKRMEQEGDGSTTAALEYSIEEILSQIGIGFYQYRLFVILGLAFTADAVEVNLLSFLAPCAQEDWGLTNAEASSITSVVFAGELAGAVFWGPLADRHGRRRSVIGCGALVTGAGLLSALCPNLATLLLCRFLVGFGVGGFTVPFDLMVEFIPAEGRGTFLFVIREGSRLGSRDITKEDVQKEQNNILQDGNLGKLARKLLDGCFKDADEGLAGFWSLGSTFIAAMAWAVLDSSGWRSLLSGDTKLWKQSDVLKRIFFLVALGALPVGLSTAAGLYLPESPRWLLAQHRRPEAHAILAEAAKRNGTPLPQDFGLVHRDLGEESSWGALLRPQFRRDSLACWAIWFCFGFVYYGVVLVTVKIFAADGEAGTCSFDYSDIFVSASSELVAIVVAARYMIDRLGRLNTQKLTYGLCGVFIFIAGLLSSTGSSNNSISASVFVSRWMIFIANNATWIMTPELYPTEIRGTAHSAANAFARIGAALVPYWIGASLPIMNICTLLAFISIVAFLAIFFVTKETAGHALDNEDSLGHELQRKRTLSFASSKGAPGEIHHNGDGFENDRRHRSRSSSLVRAHSDIQQEIELVEKEFGGAKIDNETVVRTNQNRQDFHANPAQQHLDPGEEGEVGGGHSTAASDGVQVQENAQIPHSDLGAATLV